MATLGRDDLARLLEIVTEVNQAGDLDDFFRAVLVQLVKAVPCAVASVNEVDPQSGRYNYWAEPESFSFPADAAATFSKLAKHHPLIRHYERTGDGSAHRVSEMWSTATLHQSSLYQQLYGPMGLEFQVALILPAPLPTVLGIALSREDEDFSDHDVAFLNALRPYLVQAWLSTSDHERLRALAGAATNVVSDQGWGVVVLSGPPEELTPGALATIEEFFGPRRANEALPDALLDWLAEVERPTVSASAGAIDVRPPLEAERSRRRVVLRYLPPQGAQPAAIVVRDVRYTGERGQSQRAKLESLLLTPREAEIVHLVTLGEPNSSIARALGISPGTVKKHLDNVYKKIGVGGRGPLTAFVLDVT